MSGAADESFGHLVGGVSPLPSASEQAPVPGKHLSFTLFSPSKSLRRHSRFQRVF